MTKIGLALARTALAVATATLASQASANVAYIVGPAKRPQPA
jgi:hypothetical protein